ncbi:MAG: phosphoribosylanthranilate isomerase [Pseudomonadota bacterium]
MVRVKICGLSEPDTVQAAARAGADWIGFTFVEASPRYVTVAAAASLLLHVGDAVPVALLVDPSDADVDAVIGLGIRTLQLHGGEPPDRVDAIKARTGAEVWKALGVAGPEDLAVAETYGRADRILLDAKPPADAGRTGGHGDVFDWSVLVGWEPPGPWMLAGGLTPENVRAAIAQTRAPAVDVSSGVERHRGIKSAALIKEFIAAAKAA